MMNLRTGWRRFQRVIPAPEAPVEVRVTTPFELVLHASDISEGGMELRHAEPELVRVDDLLTLALHLPSSAPVRAHARVRHVDPGRIGLVFTELTPVGREAIRRYIRSNSADRSLWNRLRQLWQA